MSIQSQMYVLKFCFLNVFLYMALTGTEKCGILLKGFAFIAVVQAVRREAADNGGGYNYD